MNASRFRGIWYSNQKQNDAFGWKYSGGLATYPQQIMPLAVYSPEALRTYFCYAGADASNNLENSVAYFDHSTKKFSDPHVVLRRLTNDAHYNSCIALAPDGHILIFCNSHGIDLEQPKDDPTYGKSYIFRSQKPHNISAFEVVLEDNFSYSQVWPVPGQGMIWLHTRYQGHDRPLYVSQSRDGISWSAPRQLVRIARGSYQISWLCGDRIVTAFDYHPLECGLNARTNLYMMESRDLGNTWKTLTGEPLSLPLTDVLNPALEVDWEKEGLLVYLKDIAFDSSGNPHVLLVTSHDCWSGPKGDPRTLVVGSRQEGKWIWSPVCPVDHNYDHGCLWIHDQRNWEVIAPTGPGLQPRTTGGEIQRWRSEDQGGSWKMIQSLTPSPQSQHTYVRKPLLAHPDFSSFWADGDAIHPSPSHLYFADQNGSCQRMS